MESTRSLQEFNGAEEIFNGSTTLVPHASPPARATTRIRHADWSVRWTIAAIALFAWLCLGAMTLSAQEVKITKSSNAVGPVPSGQDFTYTLMYSWEGGAPGSITITDLIDSKLDVVSTFPSSPIATVTGQLVTFVMTPSNSPGLTASSGAGTVQINVKFKEGVTCNGAVACNVASITLPNGTPVLSNRVCNIAFAENKWTFEKTVLAGCAVDDEVIFRVCVTNPSGGNIGGINLNNVQLTDVLPTGATVNAISGAWTGFSQSGSNVMLTGGPTNLVVSPFQVDYCVYLHVRFPSPTFAAGNTVTNQAKLRFLTPCVTDTGGYETFNAAASVTLCKGITDAELYKALMININFPNSSEYLPTFSPGCCGTYQVGYKNKGSVAQPGLVMEDLVPSSLSVKSIRTEGPWWASPTNRVTVEIYLWNGSSCSSIPNASYDVMAPAANLTLVSTLNLGPDPMICKVKWIYSQPIAVHESVWNYLDVCVRTIDYATNLPVVSGQNIVNTMNVQGTGLPLMTTTHTKAVDALSPKILSTKLLMGACKSNGDPAPEGPFVPGSIVRWRLAVANVGNTDALNCVITDALAPGFTYHGNAKFSIGPFVSMTNPYLPACTSLADITSTNPSPTSETGTITPLSAIGASSANFSIQKLPFQCDGTVRYLIIEFDVRVGTDPAVAPGQYPNCFTFSAGNLATPVTSNCPVVTINGVAQLTMQKEVRLLPNGTFSSSVSAPPGSQVEYRLTVKNTGNLALKDICLLDIMPHAGDIEVLSSTSAYALRGSTLDLPLASPIATPLGYTVGYDNTKNPMRTAVCSGFCGAVDPAAGLGVGALVNAGFGGFSGSPYSFRISSQGTTQLPANGTFVITATATVPQDAKSEMVGCNSFAVKASPVGTTDCLTTQSATACVTVVKPVCDGLWGEGRIDDCCGYTVTLSNKVGTVTKLQYHVLDGSGVVNGVTSSPCTPTSTVPASLAGTTKGTLNFSASCTQNSPLEVSFDAQSTTAGGKICIELIAMIDRDGVITECRDTICFNCDPAPKTRCDTMKVAPHEPTSGKWSWRTFKVVNQKNPTSPIRQIRISLTPDPYGPPGGVHWMGTGLHVDGLPVTWTATNSKNASNPTSFSLIDLNCSPSQASLLNTAAAISDVRFTLGVDYAFGWTGTIKVTTIHCDGDSCVSTYTWCAEKNWIKCVDTPLPNDHVNHSKVMSRLFVEMIRIHGDDRSSVRYATVVPVDAQRARVFALGAREIGATEPVAGIDQSSIFSDENQSRYAALIEFDRLLTRKDTVNWPIIIEIPAADTASALWVNVTLYDAESNILMTELVDLGPISSVGDDEREAMASRGVFLYIPEPTPASGPVKLGYKLTSAQAISLDLYDATGGHVAEIEAGFREPGEHAATFDAANLASGTYFVVLTTPAGTVTQPVLVRH